MKFLMILLIAALFIAVAYVISVPNNGTPQWALPAATQDCGPSG